MRELADGMNYAPQAAKPQPVVEAGQFVFAAAHLDHGHIYGQCNGLTEAGGQLRYVYDPDPRKVAAFVAKFPQVKQVDCLERIFEDPEVCLLAAAAIPSERGALGCRAMQAGLDYFTDKCPFTTLEQLEQARFVAAQTGRKYMVYYSERLHVESAWYVDELIQRGAIGEIVHMEIFGPHRLSRATRPEWFFQKARYGGILADIASHQFDQFLHYTRSSSAQVLHARVANFANPQTPELEDMGEAVLRMQNGASCFSRVNWLTPQGMRGWGDGRTFITGTRGSIEVRKYFDLGRSNSGNLILLADAEGEQVLDVNGKVGFPFFGQLILDCLNRTENAMTQEHAFLAAELALRAQQMADARAD